ncbi:O-antigen ligase family protein [candidate division KSB1 bacterium]|nr:O-antigen ligase family protein [candidate division KSB1 bacterium]
MGELTGAIIFTSLALGLAAGVLKLKKPVDIMMSAALISAPWWGGVWVEFIALDIRLTHLFLIAALVMSKKPKITIRKQDRITMSIILPSVLLIVWLLISSFQAYDPALAISGVVTVLLNFLYLITILSVSRNMSTIDYMLKSIAIGLIVTSVIALFQYKIPFFHIGFVTRDFTTFMFWRTRSTFHHANQYGTYQLLLLPLIFRQMVIEFKNKGSKKIYFYVFVFCLSAFTLYTTGNRGSWIGLLFGMVLTIFLDLLRSGSGRTKRVLMRVIVVVLVMASVFSVRYGKRIYDRFYGQYESDYKSQLENRKELDRDAYRLIKLHPYFGCGYKNFNFHKTTPIFTHNLYLLVMSEAGIVGFALFMLIILGFLRQSMKIRKVRNFVISNQGSALLSVVAGLLLASYVGPDLWISDQVSSHLWIVVGVVIATYRIFQDMKIKYMKRNNSQRIELDERMRVQVESYSVEPQKKM